MPEPLDFTGLRASGSTQIPGNALPIQKARIEKIPSLLGRDFLNKYSVLLKHSDNLVLITDEDVIAA